MNILVEYTEISKSVLNIWIQFSTTYDEHDFFPLFWGKQVCYKDNILLDYIFVDTYRQILVRYIDYNVMFFKKRNDNNVFKKNCVLYLLLFILYRFGLPILFFSMKYMRNFYEISIYLSYENFPFSWNFIIAFRSRLTEQFSAYFATNNKYNLCYVPEKACCIVACCHYISGIYQFHFVCYIMISIKFTHNSFPKQTLK